MLYKTFSIKNKHYVYDTVSSNIFITSKSINDFLDNKKDKKNLKNSEKKFVSLLKSEKYLKNKYEKIQFDLLDDFQNKFRLTEDSIKKLTIVLNQKCNFNCKYCLYCDSYKQRKNLDNTSMKIETAKKAIDFYLKHSKNIKHKNITIYGGEPLLDFEKLSKLIKYARKKYNSKDLRINLTSNGYLINKKIINFFNENKIFLNISFDGPKEIHDKYRVTKNKNETFEIVLKNILKIKKYFPKYFNIFLSLSVTITPPYKYKEIEDFFRNHKDLKSLKLDLSYVEEKDADWIKNKNIYQKKLNEEKAIIKDCTKKYINKESISDLYKNIYFTRLKTIAMRPMNIEDEKLIIKGPCFPSLSMLVVNTKGEFNICTMLDDCYNIGNLKEGLDKKKIKKSLQDIFEYIDNNCRECWLNRLCHPCIAKFNQKEKIPKRREICDYRRSVYLEIIKAYIKINNQ